LERREKQKTVSNRLYKILALTLVFALASGVDLVNTRVSAATYLTNSYIRLNRMAASTPTSFRIVFKPSSSGATSVAINFNGADTTTWTGSTGGLGAQASQTDSVSTCPAEATAVALPGAHTFTVAGSTLTINSVSALTAGTVYCDDLTFASAVTTPTAGEYHPTITVGPDSDTVAVRTISTDQFVVSGTVVPTFNLALSGNADSFTANLAPGSVVSTTGVTATINTNGKTGWVAWAKGQNAGLTSATRTKTIPATTPGTAATLSAGTEGNVYGVTAITQGTGAGVTTAAPAYDATASGGVNSNGSGLDTSIRQVAQSTGTAGNTILTLKERAAISAVTPAAADYTDTITLIAAGSF
jgi:hypothetical protein